MKKIQRPYKILMTDYKREWYEDYRQGGWTTVKVTKCECSECGNRVNSLAKFCDECGVKFNGVLDKRED